MFTKSSGTLVPISRLCTHSTSNPSRRYSSRYHGARPAERKKTRPPGLSAVRRARIVEVSSQGSGEEDGEVAEGGESTVFGNPARRAGVSAQSRTAGRGEKRTVLEVHNDGNRERVRSEATHDLCSREETPRQSRSAFESKQRRRTFLIESVWTRKQSSAAALSFLSFSKPVRVRNSGLSDRSSRQHPSGSHEAKRRARTTSPWCTCPAGTAGKSSCRSRVTC